jgi:sulfur carrier protein
MTSATAKPASSAVQVGQVFQLIVNGVPVDVAAQSVAELLLATGYADTRVATALNGDFVPERARSETKLKSGDRLEILTPRQGG